MTKLSAPNDMAMIKPFSYHDPETGNDIVLSVSPFYSKLVVNGQEYYFVRETGEFDGTGQPVRLRPTLIYEAE